MSLPALWDALERHGCAVDRVALDELEPGTVTALRLEAERRLRVLAEEDLPNPEPQTYPKTAVDDVELFIGLVAKACGVSPQVTHLRGVA